jgi:hypothetical protein
MYNIQPTAFMLFSVFFVAVSFPTHFLTVWAGCSSYFAVIRGENARQTYSSLLRKHRAATVLQRNLRGWLARRYFVKIRKASVVIQSGKNVVLVYVRLYKDRSGNMTRRFWFPDVLNKCEGIRGCLVRRCAGNVDLLNVLRELESKKVHCLFLCSVTVSPLRMHIKY